MVKGGTSFVWTDDEVELLLKVTQEYHEVNVAENIDWESVQSKYSDILERFREHYHSEKSAAATGKDYPHKPEEITKVQLSTKLKNIRNKYRRAMVDGRKRHHGRVILLYSELCDAIWSGCPAARPLPTGIESLDLLEGPVEGAVESGAESTLVEDGVADASASAEIVGDQRWRLNTTLGGSRRERLKRRLPVDIAQEDLELRRSLVQQIRQSDAEFIQRLDEWSSTMRSVSSTMSSLSSSLTRMVGHRDVDNGGGEGVPEVVVEIPDDDFSQDEESEEMNYPIGAVKRFREVAREEDDISIFVKHLERKLRKLKDTRILLQLQNEIERLVSGH